MSSYNSCLCSKSQKLPFVTHSLKSKRPLNILYTDAWGPSPIKSMDGFSYFVICVDHYTKYVWLDPLKNKYDLFLTFQNYKQLIENYFQTKIIIVYLHGGGEYVQLKNFFSSLGLHLQTPPHTP